MPHTYDHKKKKGGQGNKGRQPGSTGAPQTPKKPPNGGSNGGSKSSTSKSSNGGVDAKGALEAGIALSKSLANASNAKKFRDAGVSALLGKEVSANEKLSDSMDVTSFHNAYGSRNTDITGHDMSKMTDEERQRIYGV